MNDVLPPALAFGAGLLLGAFYFGGLWWTVRKGVASARPALWFSGSMLLRISITLAGFYVVGHAHGERLVACLLGFIAARALVVRLTRSPDTSPTRAAQEARHAP